MPLSNLVKTCINAGFSTRAPHGKFGELVEWATGLKERQCQQYMRLAQVYGDEIRTRVRFSNKVLIELSRPSVPESARESAAMVIRNVSYPAL